MRGMRHRERPRREVLQELRSEAVNRNLLHLCALLTVCVSILAVSAYAQVEMPDPSAIAGTPLPAPELPDRTVTVRVVRERMGNNIAGQDVTLTVGTAKRTLKTDAQGRAQFDGLAVGAQVQATT